MAGLSRGGESILGGILAKKEAIARRAEKVYRKREKHSAGLLSFTWNGSKFKGGDSLSQRYQINLNHTSSHGVNNT